MNEIQLMGESLFRWGEDDWILTGWGFIIVLVVFSLLTTLIHGKDD